MSSGHERERERETSAHLFLLTKRNGGANSNQRDLTAKIDGCTLLGCSRLSLRFVVVERKAS